ncbi:MAG TPA: hypothetical protein VG407_01265 [Caulobacteraceae bacterium]|jgi:hypothetical protein|nr:hypothetical protein [Caulobacteraceae bacterium]
MITALLLTALLGASGGDTPPAPGAQGSAPVVAPTAKPVKTDDKDRVVCHREDGETGSHRVVKICHTKREWDEMTDEAQRLFREGGIQAVDRSVANGGMPSGGLGGGQGGAGPH